jgi:hypothetical protein
MKKHDALNKDPDIQIVPDAWARSFVPYNKQLEYARNWWSSENQTFRTASSLEKKTWLDDALLDASNISFEYDKLYDGAGGGDWLDYKAAWMFALISHKNDFRRILTPPSKPFRSYFDRIEIKD